MGLFAAIWNGFRQLLGLVLPFFSKARDLKGMGPQLRNVLHVVMLVVILAGLAFLNYALDFDKLLPVRWPPLRNNWAPLLFLLVYILSWLGWWLWKLLQPEEETSLFPDIDDAWAEAVKALEQGNIDLTEAIVFGGGEAGGARGGIIRGRSAQLHRETIAPPLGCALARLRQSGWNLRVVRRGFLVGPASGDFICRVIGRRIRFGLR